MREAVSREQRRENREAVSREQRRENREELKDKYKINNHYKIAKDEMGVATLKVDTKSDA